jgi:hypothetical protein
LLLLLLLLLLADGGPRTDGTTRFRAVKPSAALPRPPRRRRGSGATARSSRPADPFAVTATPDELRDGGVRGGGGEHPVGVAPARLDHALPLITLLILFFSFSFSFFFFTMCPLPVSISTFVF